MPEPPKGTDPKASLRDLRRTQIVAVARRIVAEDGLEALTFGALEQRLDFTRGVITYHFENKDDIVEAVLDSAIAEIDGAMQTRLEGASSLEERVRAVLLGQVRGWLDHPEAGRIMLAIWGRLGADPKSATKNARLYERYRRESAALCAGAADPDVVAALLVGTVLGIACQIYFQPAAFDVEAAVAEAARMFMSRLRSRR